MGKSLLSAPPHFGLKLLVDDAGNIGYEDSSGNMKLFWHGNFIGMRYATGGSVTSFTTSISENSIYAKYLLILIHWSSSNVPSTNCTYQQISEAVKSSQVLRVYEITPTDYTQESTFAVNNCADGYILIGMN